MTMPREPRLLDYVNDPIGSVLIRTAMPILLASLASSSGQLINSFFISKLGTTSLGVISLYIPIMYLFIALFECFQVTTQVSVAVSRGQGQRTELAHIASSSLFLGMVATLLVCMALAISLPWLPGLMGAGPELAGPFRTYLLLVLAANLFNMAGAVANSVLRAIGDVRTSVWLSLLSVALSVALHPAMIFGLNLGIAGAGWALILSSATVAACAWLAVRRHRNLFAEGRRSLRPHPIVARYLGLVGAPVFMGFLVMFISTFLYERIVAPYGVPALAGFGIAYRWQMLLLLPAVGIGEALRAVMGQNLGARRLRRVWEAYAGGLKLTVGVYAVLGLLVWWSAPALAAVLSHGAADVEAVAAGYLRMIGPTYAFMGCALVTSGALETLSKGILSLAMTMLYYLGLIAAPALLMGSALGLDGFWRLIAVANLLSLPAVALTAYWVRRNFGEKSATAVSQ